MLLQKLFSNKAFLKALGIIGAVILVILVVSYVVAWISVLVWCLTHHIHHSTFTWYLVWTTWLLVGIGSVIAFIAVVED